jgi:hypothetical protein
MVSFVAMFWKIRFANDPLALKAAEDARIDRAAARKRNRMIKLTRKELVWVLRRELPGAKVRQFASNETKYRWDMVRGTFRASFDYAGTTLAVVGSIEKVYKRKSRAYNWISGHEAESTCQVVVDDQAVVQINYYRPESPLRKEKHDYYDCAGGTQISRSAFLDKIAGVVGARRVVEEKERADEEAARRAEEASRQQLADGTRSRKSELAS